MLYSLVDAPYTSRRDLKFDSGGIRQRSTDEPVSAVSEEDVFRAMNIPWICVSPLRRVHRRTPLTPRRHSNESARIAQRGSIAERDRWKHISIMVEVGQLHHPSRQQAGSARSPTPWRLYGSYIRVTPPYTQCVSPYSCKTPSARFRPSPAATLPRRRWLGPAPASPRSQTESQSAALPPYSTSPISK